MLPWILCGILSIVIVMLLTKILLLRQSMDEIRREFRERLSDETNILISISSGDARAKRLASDINAQLRILRKQRNQYLSGDRELKEAITNISHDLRTPLTAICGYLDMMEHEEKSDAMVRYLSFIANRVELLKQLTEELFRYSVILSKPEDLRLEPVCVNTVLEESLAAFYPAIMERNILPSVKMPEQKVMRLLDKAAISRVFGNILSNAVKYSDGDMTVSLSDDGELIFTNTASGLNELQVDRLFNRFYTVETARNSTGLGLAIARTMVERMNGEMFAQYSEDRLSIFVRLFDDV